MMKKPRNKVPYRTESKRHLLKDVLTDAGRRAKHREAEKIAEDTLRAALDHPRDEKGKPIAGHLVNSLAASFIRTGSGMDRASDFEFAAGEFLGKLTYQRWGYATTVSSLWKTFLTLVEAADPDCVREFARTRERDFRFCAMGHVQRLKLEYERLPYAFKVIEIWKSKDGNVQIGVQNDGKRRVIPFDQPPEPPMLWRAGAKVSHWIAPEDLKRMKKMGHKQFLANLDSGKIKLLPRPIELLTEDTFLNVAPPTPADLIEISKNLPFMIGLARFQPKPRARKSGA